MSEVKLNLIDSRIILSGTIHGSIAEACIAALSAEPETIPELAAALGRYAKATDDSNPFSWFHPRSEIDDRPYDAGIVVVDLAARIGAAESTYSDPQLEGEVNYHDGTQGTDISIPFRVPEDWLFVKSIDAYRWSRERRLQERKPAFDARPVLYGKPLLEFIVGAITPEILALKSTASTHEIAFQNSNEEPVGDGDLGAQLVRIHAAWLTTPREDLLHNSPRDIMLEKQDFIDFDLHTRCLQWSFLNEGPPCLAKDSYAYRFAGFGTHEWVVYYDLVRYLLRRVVELDCRDRESAVARLELLKTDWLESGNDEFDGRTPAVIIDNERKRLPEALAPEQLIIDENCECCRMMAQDAAMGFGPGFWHLDGSHMEEEFAFSSCKTMQEWEAELQRREQDYLDFERRWAEREQQRRSLQREWDEAEVRIACGDSADEEVTLDWPDR